MYLLIAIMLFSTIASCASIEDGWKGIKPMRTEKSAVDKIFGVPEVDENGYYRYTADNETFIEVNYSTAPCRDDPFKRGKFKVAASTVLDYSVVMKKAFKLSDLEFKHKKYYKDTSGDLVNFMDYINPDDGVTIGVMVQQGDEYVRNIRFRPAKNDSERFSCEK